MSDIVVNKLDNWLLPAQYLYESLSY